jgi:hypothetical protein
MLILWIKSGHAAALETRKLRQVGTKTVPRRCFMCFRRLIMATIDTPPAGTFKPIMRNTGRIVKTKTFKLKKNARIRATRIEIEGDGNPPEK